MKIYQQDAQINSKVFQTDPRGLPKLLDVPPVSLKLKKDFKPQCVKHQSFGPHTARLSAHLTKGHMRSGLLEDCHDSAWASRTHFALKAAAGERLDGPSFKLRECGDYRNVNTQLRLDISTRGGVTVQLMLV